MRGNLDIIEFLARHLDRSDLRAAVKCVLLDLYFAAGSDGYRSLVLGILLYHDDPEQSLTKELYPKVGRLQGIRDTQVEKQIRTAIASARKKCDPEIWEMYFPKGGRPSNKVFISKIAEILDVWMRCTVDGN